MIHPNHTYRKDLLLFFGGRKFLIQNKWKTVKKFVLLLERVKIKMRMGILQGIKNKTLGLNAAITSLTKSNKILELVLKWISPPSPMLQDSEKPFKCDSFHTNKTHPIYSPCMKIYCPSSPIFKKLCFYSIFIKKHWYYDDYSLRAIFIMGKMLWYMK